MAGFVRRYTYEPTIEVLTQIEGVVIIDLAPPPPITGSGTGTVLLFGEMEDGPFAADADEGPLEVYGSSDLKAKFGGFGYQYGGLVSQNPAARRHLQEDWNGNGFLKLFKLRAQRLLIARVDTSVGTVSFEPLACVGAQVGPYALADGQVLTATTDTGGPADSDAVDADTFSLTGDGEAVATLTSGEQISIRIDGGPAVIVNFASTDVTVSAVVSRINAALGYTGAADVGGEVSISALKVGYGASIELADVSPGTLAKLGLPAGLWEPRPYVVGSGQAVGGISASDEFDITIDGGTPITVVFPATPADVAAAAAVINSQVGQTVAYVHPNGELIFYGGTRGTSGSIALAAGTPDALANLGHSAGTTNGVHNVSDVTAVTAAEVAAIVNGSSALTAIGVVADVTASGAVRICSDTPGDSLTVTTTNMAAALGLTPLDNAVAPGAHAGGSIPAGTRVRNSGGDEWVTMQTLDIPAADLGPYTVKVRPATDDGSAGGANGATVTTLVDQPSFAYLSATNPAALGSAMTEAQLDNAYVAAMTATLNPQYSTREANFTLSARRSEAIVREGLANALSATANGLAARKFITGDPLNTTLNQAIANVASFASAASDRLFYTAKGLKVRVPEIAAIGVAGGTGFTADGVITVRPDGPLATVCATLPPENNPGQQTGLIEDFFEVSTFGEVLDREAYEAAKRSGIALPRRDRQSGTIFQSGVTTSTDPARTTMARRKMADFIQDTAAEVLDPYSKRLNSQARRDQVRAIWEQFLSGLQSENDPDQARIEAYEVDDSVNVGNTPAVLARGVYYLETRVRVLSSLDVIVVRTEIGEGTIISAS